MAFGEHLQQCWCLCMALPHGTQTPAHARFPRRRSCRRAPGHTHTAPGPGRGGTRWGCPGGRRRGLGQAGRPGLCPHAAPHPRLPLQHWRLRVARRGSWAGGPSGGKEAEAWAEALGAAGTAPALVPRMNLSGVKSISPWLGSQLIPANQRSESGSGSGSGENAKPRLLKGTEALAPQAQPQLPDVRGRADPRSGTGDLGHRWAQLSISCPFISNLSLSSAHSTHPTLPRGELQRDAQ